MFKEYLIIIFISIFGISKLEVENSFINYFSKNTEIYKGMKLIDEKLGGTTPLEVIIKFPKREKSEKSDEEPQVIKAGDSSLTIYQNTQEESEDYQMTADEIAIHEAFSKLFKKLALKLHPDRINKFLPEDEKEIRAKEFKEANEAFDKGRYFFLLDIADKYRVSTPRNYEQQTRWMKREAQKIQGLISQKKNTYSYGFAEAETEEEKELLIRKFIFQLFRINV